MVLFLCPISADASQEPASSIENGEYCEKDSFIAQWHACSSAYEEWGRILLEFEDDLAVMTIPAFSSTTSKQSQAVASLMKKAGIEKLLIDLRGNQGGDVFSAVKSAARFSPGNIAFLHIVGRPPVLYASRLKEPPFQMAVLVNAFTASAAELFAASMRMTGRACLIGTTTYGKSSIQKVQVDENGEVTKQEAGYYLLADGTNISGVGIVPDEILMAGNADWDVQMARAKEFLNGAQCSKF
jgi:carboxyl-terminal processing protease